MNRDSKTRPMNTNTPRRLKNLNTVALRRAEVDAFHAPVAGAVFRLRGRLVARLGLAHAAALNARRIVDGLRQELHDLARPGSRQLVVVLILERSQGLIVRVADHEHLPPDLIQGLGDALQRRLVLRIELPASRSEQIRAHQPTYRLLTPL